MTEPPQVIVATPGDYPLVITVDCRGAARLHTSLPKAKVVRFLRLYADDIEAGRPGGELSGEDTTGSGAPEVHVDWRMTMAEWQQLRTLLLASDAPYIQKLRTGGELDE